MTLPTFLTKGGSYKMSVTHVRGDTIPSSILFESRWYSKSEVAALSGWPSSEIDSIFTHYRPKEGVYSVEGDTLTFNSDSSSFTKTP
jgi:hypothetical protein